MARSRKSQENMYKLKAAQRKLAAEISRLMKENTNEDYRTEVTPQVLRLIGQHEYHSRDLVKINSLLGSPSLLKDHVAVIDRSTGEMVRGGKAAARHVKRIKSSGYHAPIESEVVLSNFTTEVEDSFPDDTVYQQFMDVLTQLMNGDTSVGDGGLWESLHPGIFTTSSGKARSSKDVQRSKDYFVQDVNRSNITDIRMAVDRLIAVEGIESVVRRLQVAGEDIVNALIIAGIGYQEQSGRAVQAVLKVLLPNATKERAMAMGDVSELISDFNGEMQE